MIRVLLLGFAALCFVFLCFKWTMGPVPLLAAGLLAWVLADLLAGVGPPFGRRASSQP